LNLKDLKKKEIEILCSQRFCFLKKKKKKPKKWKLVVAWPPWVFWAFLEIQ